MGTHRSRESLRLTNGGQSASGASRSKIPGFEHAYRRRTNPSRPQMRASTSEALWPPNPNELLIATSTFACRATFGT